MARGVRGEEASMTEQRARDAMTRIDSSNVRPATTVPATAAGRALLERFNGLPDYHGQSLRPSDILAIEAEIAAATSREALRAVVNYFGEGAHLVIEEGTVVRQAAPAAGALHRQHDELGHASDGQPFHVAQCVKCGLMLAYLVRDQVECQTRAQLGAARLAAPAAAEGERHNMDPRIDDSYMPEQS
jgi:hypothetical protein